jgi:hypothetical protein
MLNRWTGSILSLLALVLILGGTAGAAQTAAPKKAPAAAAKKAPAVHEMTGTGVVTSMDATHLMITHKVAGKDAPMTLVLTPTTKRTGTLAAGSKVTVKYHMENNDAVATSVSAQAVTAKAKTAKAPAAKKS